MLQVGRQRPGSGLFAGRLFPEKRGGARIAAATVALLAGAVGLIGGCSATEYHYEGNGIEEDPASSSVPTGMLGVCKRRFSEKPPIVNPVLWEHAKWCTASTPASFVRLGYGQERGDMEKARLRVQKM